MAIDDLTSFIPPPSSPIQTSGDWSVAEQDLGVVFPSDFKDLIQTYGTGEFFGNLGIENPLREWGRDGIRDRLERYRELREACEWSFPLFPESPGLLPWGSDDNGHLYCWWTEGQPDDWSIVQLFHGYEEDPLEIVPGPITQFLIDFVSNKYPNMLGGNERSSEHHKFRVGILGRNHGDD
ncbi:MAG: SMI1/KNR4 family protein [Planctomycetaceae bacterium]|nr:SMI1/KNR4 family protein [Planctomycetaceae bacterium]